MEVSEILVRSSADHGCAGGRPSPRCCTPPRLGAGHGSCQRRCGQPLSPRRLGAAIRWHSKTNLVSKGLNTTVPNIARLLD